MSKINDNGVERDMTDAEQAEYDAWAAQMQTLEAAQADAVAAKEAARQSAVDKLAALGLTVDEISAAFGLES